VTAASTPLYRRIAGELRTAIRSGKLPPGSQVPTEPELAEQYGVSRGTVRVAVAELVSEGLVERSTRRGTIVRDLAPVTYYATRAESDRPAAGAAAAGDAYIDEVRGQGRRPTQQLEVRVTEATDEIAARLWTGEGGTVVLRRCWRYVDGRPWSIQDSYYPQDVAEAAGLLEPGDIAGGTIRRMANAGHVEVGYVDEITARPATTEEARWLELGRGAAALVYVRTAYTTARPVRLTTTVFGGDRQRLVYELRDLTALYDSDHTPA